MALFAYQQLTQLLLRDVTQEEFNPGDLTTYINIARNQVAGEGQCVRYVAKFTTTPSVFTIAFYQATIVAGLGINTPLNVRNLSYNVNSNYTVLTFRPFEWFFRYCYNNNTPSGNPTTWTQYGEGEGGYIYLYPTPGVAIPLQADCACVPNPLALDTDNEAIPPLWTDAIPYYAAYQALLSSKDEKARGEAKGMWERYAEFMARARRFATTPILPAYVPMAGVTQPSISQRGGGNAV